MAVNLTSAYRLIRSLEPLLRPADAGRAIFLTSGAAARPEAFWGAYAATKAGLEALVRCWADEVESTPIRAVLLDPGAMRTEMRDQAYPGRGPGDPDRPGRDRADDRRAGRRGADLGPADRETVKFSRLAVRCAPASAPGTP